MKQLTKTLGAVAALALLAGTCILMTQRSGTPAPSYAVEQRFDAGETLVMLPGELKHRFEYINDTDQTIEITAIKPACGCTAIEAPIRTLEPGQTGWLEATADLHASGQFSTLVTVHWSTGQQTQYLLGAFVIISRELSLSAMSLDLEPGEHRQLILTYIDQRCEEPGAISLEGSPALDVEIGPWQQVLPGDRQRGLAARYSARVSVQLTGAIDEIGRASFALPAMPDVLPTELVVRTPALARSLEQQLRQRRPTSGPIQIAHDAPGGDADETMKSERP